LEYLSKIGAGLLIVALILTYLAETGYALGVLLIIALLDLYLEATDKPTISHWIHLLFKKKIDFIIMIGILGFTWWVISPVGFLPVCIGCIVGHLFWQSR